MYVQANEIAYTVPLNQSANRAESATTRLSPPKPNTSRPMNITGHDLIEMPKL